MKPSFFGLLFSGAICILFNFTKIDTINQINENYHFVTFPVGVFPPIVLQAREPAVGAGSLSSYMWIKILLREVFQGTEKMTLIKNIVNL